MTSAVRAPHGPLQILLIAALIPLWTGVARAGDTSFYTLHSRWEKNNEEKAAPTDVERTFGEALVSRGAQYLPSVPSAPQPLRRTAAEVEAVRSLTLELGQSLFLELGAAPRKFVSTQEGVVGFEPLGTVLRIEALSIGETFVHVWDTTGRRTFQVLVRPARILESSAAFGSTADEGRAKSFKFGYQAARSAFYTSDKFSELRRSTLDVDQKVSMSGETPYGMVGAHAQAQKERAKYVITDAQVSLKDGRIGPFREFDAALGDSSVGSDLMVFPGTRIRGARVDHHPEEGRVDWTGFFGREQTSVVGTLTPGLFSRKTRTSFLGGGIVDYRLNGSADVRAGYFNGYGRSRPDELNRHGYGVRPEFRLGPHVVLEPELSYDNESFANKHAATVRLDKIRVRNEFRDIERDFQTLIGIPSRQGEVGNLLQVSAAPTDRVQIEWAYDAFRDRLVPNPLNPDRFNYHNDVSLQWTPFDRTSLLMNYQNYDDTGRLGPTKQRGIGGQLVQGFDLWGRRVSVYARYQNRGNRNLQNPLSDYVQNQITVGLNTQLAWGINFNVQQEWYAVEEPNARRLTHPSATTYSLDWSSRLWDTPLFMDLRARYRDEEETESPFSFMSGEDVAEISGGLYYREIEDLEIFLTGSLQQYRPESLNISAPRTEGQFLTGVKAVFDTGWRLESVGAVEGIVFKDIDGDGQRAEGEPGLPGIGVSLEGGASAETGADGTYRIEGARGRTVNVTVDASDFPEGYNATSSVRLQVPVVGGGVARADFGLSPRSEVTGVVYEDRDGNGRYDRTDEPVRKVRVRLDDGKTAVTNTGGSFFIPGVLAGDRTATLDLSTLPDGYLPLGPPKRQFTLYEGMRYELSYPLRAQRTISGRIYADDDRNGKLDASERPLSGVRVTAAGRESITDKDGYYLLEGLQPGRAEIALDPSTLPEGYEPDILVVEIARIPAPLEGIDIGAKRSR
ncbi:MAG: hypothetical protein MOGMAGMI_01490 [Candidatus Omnitrophica bacterium]|nr:hypothetical protein [Candidatus Omnitrophota bacterium]